VDDWQWTLLQAFLEARANLDLFTEGPRLRRLLSLGIRSFLVQTQVLTFDNKTRHLSHTRVGSCHPKPLPVGCGDSGVLGVLQPVPSNERQRSRRPDQITLSVIVHVCTS
jgi:hypothetical protein